MEVRDLNCEVGVWPALDVGQANKASQGNSIAALPMRLFDFFEFVG